MPNATEVLASQMIHALHAATDGRAQKWVMLHTIAKRLKLMNDNATDAAVKLAVGKGWLLFEGGHSICLTDGGRKRVQ